jgi:PadR family transcriptional regulator, regulatory protein AphA
MSSRSLTTSSYAILGLLAIQPWATYDLAKLMRRSLHFFWPRAESNLYAEPKRLVELGMAEADEEWNGDRKRTVYSITERGRAALGEWLATETAGQRLESEPHLRVLYANYGTPDDLLATIDRIETDAEATIEHYGRLCEEYARGEGLFPDRIHVNALLATLSIAQARAAADWARWARDAVSEWTTTETPDVDWAVRTMRERASATDAP